MRNAEAVLECARLPVDPGGGRAPGAVVADVGAVTIQSLQDAGIEYDELHFGKPWAQFYIDDCGVNAYADLEKELEKRDRTIARLEARADIARALKMSPANVYRFFDSKKAINEAANILSSDQISLQTKLALLKVLPEVIRESAKPIEAIDSIKIVQVDGLTNGGSGKASANGSAAAGGGSGNLATDAASGAGLRE